MMPTLEDMLAAQPKCTKVTRALKEGQWTSELCGRPLKYDAGRNVWMCAIPGHPDIDGLELAAAANDTMLYQDEAA